MHGKLMTYHGICKRYGKIFKKYGWVSVAHHNGDRGATIAYGVELVRLHHAIKLKMAQVRDVDKKADLQIMHDNLDKLKEIIMEHFKLRHEDIVERVEHTRQALQTAAASGSMAAGSYRPMSPRRSNVAEEIFGTGFR
jgi:hypothetical protein